MKKQHYFLHQGFTSVWEGFDIPACREVAIKKCNYRDGKKYLVFESAGAFKEFRNNSIIMGTTASLLFGTWWSDKLKAAAKQNGLTEAAADDLQNEIERNVGLYYNIKNDKDEQLMASLCTYMKYVFEQKISSV